MCMCVCVEFTATEEGTEAEIAEAPEGEVAREARAARGEFPLM